VPYEPPSGRVIDLVDEDEQDPSARQRFHTTYQCRLVRDLNRLRYVDKPYSATRCPSCARPEA